MQSSIGSAEAHNVRVEDVDNPTLQAGLEAANEKRFGDAERFFNIVLSKDHDSASAWSNLGNVHLSLGRTTQALKDFSNAIELASDAPVPYLNRALAYEQLGVDADTSGDSSQAAGYFRQAIDDCDAAVQRDPKEFAAWFNKGNVEARLQQYDSAFDSYRQAADLAPGIIGYRLREATTMYQLDGQQQDASRIMRSVTRKNPGYAEAHAALAAAEWQAGRRSQAEEQFAIASNLDENWSDPLPYISKSMRWPPRLVSAMQSFLNMSAS
ncbi:hypothetical protein WJX73_000709 [Symbiochloris irregularis]|uniref:Tetratricopeptide repeat protein n=1 Tax=Symbiochloris irregularis TaxID=706552 RepID=A0AAW1PSJ3_9CHLO